MQRRGAQGLSTCTCTVNATVDSSKMDVTALSSEKQQQQRETDYEVLSFRLPHRFLSDGDNRGLRSTIIVRAVHLRQAEYCRSEKSPSTTKPVLFDDSSTCRSTSCMEESMTSLKLSKHELCPHQEEERQASNKRGITALQASSSSLSLSSIRDIKNARRQKDYGPHTSFPFYQRRHSHPRGQNSVQALSMSIKSLPRELEILEGENSTRQVSC